MFRGMPQYFRIVGGAGMSGGTHRFKRKNNTQQWESELFNTIYVMKGCLTLFWMVGCPYSFLLDMGKFHSVTLCTFSTRILADFPLASDFELHVRVFVLDAAAHFELHVRVFILDAAADFERHVRGS